MSGHVYLFQGIRFLVTDETLKRDLKLLKIMDPGHYKELKNDDAKDDIYADLSTERLSNGYYMFYPLIESNKADFYMYIGLYLYNEYTKNYRGSSQIEFPTKDQIKDFKQFCRKNNMDFSTFGTYLIIE